MNLSDLLTDDVQNKKSGILHTNISKKSTVLAQKIHFVHLFIYFLTRVVLQLKYTCTHVTQHSKTVRMIVHKFYSMQLC